VAAELQAALESERPRNHLDMRGRLDSKGNRYGKMIDYKVSELRFVELLEGVCPDVGGYRLSAGAGDGGRGGKRWEKQSGGGGENVFTSIKARGKVMRAEIEGYCNRLVEEQEEALQEALYAKALNATNVDDYLCRKFTDECKGVKKIVKKEVVNKEEDATKVGSAGAGKAAKKGGKKGGKRGSKKGGAASAKEMDSPRDSLPSEKKEL
jgi:hypothetical protein